MGSRRQPRSSCARSRRGESPDWGTWKGDRFWGEGVAGREGIRRRDGLALLIVHLDFWLTGYTSSWFHHPPPALPCRRERTQKIGARQRVDWRACETLLGVAELAAGKTNARLRIAQTSPQTDPGLSHLLARASNQDQLNLRTA